MNERVAATIPVPPAGPALDGRYGQWGRWWTPERDAWVRLHYEPKANGRGATANGEILAELLDIPYMALRRRLQQLGLTKIEFNKAPALVNRGDRLWSWLGAILAREPRAIEFHGELMIMVESKRPDFREAQDILDIYNQTARERDQYVLARLSKNHPSVHLAYRDLKTTACGHLMHGPEFSATAEGGTRLCSNCWALLNSMHRHQVFEGTARSPERLRQEA